MKSSRILIALVLVCWSSVAFAQRGAAPEGRGAGPGRGAVQAQPNEGRGQGGPQLKIDRNLEYARRDSRPLGLDMYYMQPMATPRPLVVWIRGTDPSASARLATPAAALVSATGFAVASIDYRMGPGVTPTMQLADAKAAIRWLRANAGKYGVDPAQVAVMGFDVGGRIAALLGTTADVAELERSSPAQLVRLACKRSSLWPLR